jgi:hypothetical protein
MFMQFVRVLEHRALSSFSPRFATSAQVAMSRRRNKFNQIQNPIGFNPLRGFSNTNGSIVFGLLLKLSFFPNFSALVAKRVGTVGRSERCSNIRTNCANIKSVAPQTGRPSRATLRRKWGEAPFFAYFLWRSKESKCRPAQGSMKIKIAHITRGSNRRRKQRVPEKSKPAVAIAEGNNKRQQNQKPAEANTPRRIQQETTGKQRAPPPPLLR